MAVELGLNRYLATPPPNESEFHMRERRNRERTYLVLWVHDRSLSMQTGRQWMLPEVRLCILLPSDLPILNHHRMTSSSIPQRGTKPVEIQSGPRT